MCADPKSSDKIIEPLSRQERTGLTENKIHWFSELVDHLNFASKLLLFLRLKIEFYKRFDG